jgi:hypothetical protein
MANDAGCRDGAPVSDADNRFKERAEFLALRIIVTQMMVDAFQHDTRATRRFADNIDRVIDRFEFICPNGGSWTDDDVLRGREFMRAAADRIIAPAIPRVRPERTA